MGKENEKEEITKKLEERIVAGIRLKTTKYAKFVVTGDVKNSVGQAWQEIGRKNKMAFEFIFFLVYMKSM